MRQSLIFGALDTVLFRNFTIALASLYVTTTGVLIAGIYYVHEILGVEAWGIIALISLVITLVAGGVLANIAISPLREHFFYLERFSKETLHELNLPINTITANVEMLRKAHNDEKSLKRLERIQTATIMLQERYNELDYLIKKQSEREKIESFELTDLIEERIAFLRPLYANVLWQIELEPSMVVCDRIGLGKVIDNLVENGVKYSPQTAHITIKLENHILSLCDQGIGMDEITLMRIYDRYFQNDTTMPGYGIGLSIVKRYCDRHHIVLNVLSRPGEGTCVKLEFKKREK